MTTKRPTTDLTSWPEGALRGCARHAERSEVRARALAELDRRHRKPWLSGAERVIFGINLFAVLALIAIAFWMSSCTFPAEGTGTPDSIGCAGCYRPPHPGPYPSSHPNDIGPATDESSSSSVGGSSGDTSDEDSSTTDASKTRDGSESDTSDSGSSSTGEPEPYDPAHCDMTCPAGDALEPTEAQAGGTFPGCYCATPCETDDDCAPLEWCDPFFDRCVIPCMGDTDCLGFDKIPGSMACTLWWNSADEYTHFCAYWNEDAP